MPSNTTGSRSIYVLAGLGVSVVIVSVIAVVAINRVSSPAGSPAQANAAPNTKARTTEEVEALHDGLEAAATYVNADKLGEAEVILQGLSTRFPDEAQVWHQFYELRLMQKRPADAYVMVERLIDMGAGEDFGLRFNAGLIANQIDRLADATEHLKAACRLDPTNIQAPLYLASVYRKTHDLVSAREYLLRVIQIDKNIHQAWGGLAQIAYVENHLDTAMQYLEKARKLEPAFPTWIILEAKVLRRGNDPEQAITLLSSLTGQFRWQQEVVDEMAQCWALMGSPSRAAQEHVAYLDRNANAWPSAVAAARFFLQADDRDSALSWAAYARRIAPDDEDVKRLTDQLGP